jgi:hypothetical protein
MLIKFKMERVVFSKNVAGSNGAGCPYTEA